MIHVVIIVVVAADNMQWLREYQAEQEAKHQAAIAQLRSRLTAISCDQCAWTEWYETPGKAKMGLAGHQRRHRR